MLHVVLDFTASISSFFIRRESGLKTLEGIKMENNDFEGFLSSLPKGYQYAYSCLDIWDVIISPTSIPSVLYSLLLNGVQSKWCLDISVLSVSGLWHCLEGDWQTDRWDCGCEEDLWCLQEQDRCSGVFNKAKICILLPQSLFSC